MSFTISAASAARGVERLKKVDDLIQSMITTASSNTLDASYSGLPELSELGKTHGRVLHGSPGSALIIAQSLAARVAWCRRNLEGDPRAFLGQNHSPSKPPSSGNILQLVKYYYTRHNPNLLPRVEDFIFPKPELTTPTSLDELVHQLTDTDHVQAQHALSSWRLLSTIAQQVSEELHDIAADLRDDNVGEVVSEVYQAINTVASRAASLSITAEEMADSVQYLSEITLAFLPGVATARAFALTLEQDEQTELETEFLAQFQALFGKAIVGAIPLTHNLTDVLSCLGYGVADVIGEPECAPDLDELGKQLSNYAASLQRNDSKYAARNGSDASDFSVRTVSRVVDASTISDATSAACFITEDGSLHQNILELLRKMPRIHMKPQDQLFHDFDTDFPS
ncbi:MAG: hypothetical protein Q4A82_04645 [Corynebacterium sp.]|nr:hypothetical protein [Corynebacterium sp.]